MFKNQKHTHGPKQRSAGPGRLHGPGHHRRLELPAVSARKLAVGAFALGALAMGAVAIGALAIGKVSIGRADIGKVSTGRADIKELRVGRLQVDELTGAASAGFRAPGDQQPNVPQNPDQPRS